MFQSLSGNFIHPPLFNLQNTRTPSKTTNPARMTKKMAVTPKVLRPIRRYPDPGLRASHRRAAMVVLVVGSLGTLTGAVLA